MAAISTGTVPTNAQASASADVRRGPGSDGDRLRVVTIGTSEQLVAGIWNRIEDRAEVDFHHIITYPRAYAELKTARQDRIRFVRHHPAFDAVVADVAFVASLEHPSVPTLHNMIMGDRVASHLPYQKAVAYATSLGKAFFDYFRELRPDLIIGSYDNLDAGMSLAVARNLGIPWFAMKFTTVPPGLVGFCTGMTADTIIPIGAVHHYDCRGLAEQTLSDFEEKALVVPAHVSANTVGMVLRRLPGHALSFVRLIRRFVTGRLDEFTESSPLTAARQYLRKRLNLLALPRRWFLDEPPAQPFVFFGLHLQPESTIDVCAPFHTDQFAVIESIARSVPPTHALLVKLHLSDADNYSRRQLRRLRQLPGVRLVSPFVSSRPFVERASLVMSIQGTIANEAALLGQPVLMFARSSVTVMPGVSTVEAIDGLPFAIRGKLVEERPSREAVIDGLALYFRDFAPACYNDWSLAIPDDEIVQFGRVFESLRKYIASSGVVDAR